MPSTSPSGNGSSNTMRIARVKAEALGLAYQDVVGTVVVVVAGPGPINAEVLLGDGTSVIVPRGNLVKISKGVTE